MTTKYFGVEIEGIMNTELVDFEIHSYRNHDFGEEIPNWSATHDSSINPRGVFKQEKPVEFISKKTNFNNWDSLFNDLKGAITEQAGNVELNKVLNFNTSCGCHIHFSTSSKRENTIMTTRIYKKLRKAMLSRIETELPAVYRSFKAQYFRGYAQAQNREMIDKEARSEINYTDLSKGVEWRGFNLLGVETWEELHTMIKLALEELDKILEEIQSVDFEETIEFLIPSEDFQKINDHIDVVIG